MATTITRTQLYDRVWSTPLIRVAAELGTSNFRLAELCRRNRIPTPPAGYWSKVEFGKAVTKLELPSGEDVEIALDALQRAGYRASKVLTRAERRQTVEIPEPGIDARVERTIAKLRGQAGEGIRIVSVKGCFRIAVSEGLAPRAATVLSLLVGEVEKRGWSLKSGEGPLALVIDKYRLGFELVELTDRIPHVLTERERRAEEAYATKIAVAARTGAFVSPWDKPKAPQWDYRPNGKLSLKLDERAGYRGVRRTSSDRKSQGVETLIDCVIGALADFARAETQLAVDNERRRLEAEEAARIEAQRRKRHALELKRIEFLDRQLARADRLAKVQALLGRLEQHDTSSIDVFVSWTRRYAGTLESELSPEVMAAKIALTNLMDDDAEIATWIDVETGRYRTGG